MDLDQPVTQVMMARLAPWASAENRAWTAHQAQPVSQVNQATPAYRDQPDLAVTADQLVIQALLAHLDQVVLQDHRDLEGQQDHRGCPETVEHPAHPEPEAKTVRC